MLYNILTALRFMPNLITIGLKVIKGGRFYMLEGLYLAFRRRELRRVF